ncbi:MAG: hypothetical protein GF355_16505 [Candidatus Eisenbacteria bacterium]|nr:hypothetical protein [Candidatus Eisenbacteria bacterium]
MQHEDRPRGPGAAFRWILIGLMCGLAACSSPDPVVLQVGEESVPLSDFQKSFWEFTHGDTALARDSSGVREFLEIYINKELMEHLAGRAIPEFDEVLEDRWLMDQEDLARRLLDRRVLDPVSELSEEQLRRAHEKLKTQFHLREIRTRSRDKAERILATLEEGGVFGKIAALESEDARAKAKEGDIGWVTLGQIPEPVYDAASELNVGEVSGIIRSSVGYHLIMLEGRRPSEDVMSFEEARPALERMLGREKIGQAMIAFREELRRRFDYTLNMDNVIWMSNWLRKATAAVDRRAEALTESDESELASLLEMPEEDLQRVLATMTQDTIRAVHAIADLSRYPAATWPTFDSPEDLIMILDRISHEWLTLAEARRRELFENPHVQWLGKKKRDAIRSRQYYLRYIRPETEPTDEEVRRYYEEHRNELLQAERRRYLNIRLAARDLAAETARRLRNGEDAQSVFRWAKAQGEQTSWTGASGTGPVPSGRNQALDGVVFSLELGEVSDPIPTRNGYSVVKLLEIEDPRPRPFEDIRGNLKSNLWAEKADAYLKELIAAARDTVDIEIHEEHLSQVEPEPPAGWRTSREIIFGGSASSPLAP